MARGDHEHGWDQAEHEAGPEVEASRRAFLRLLSLGGVGLAVAGASSGLLDAAHAAPGTDAAGEVVVLVGATLVDGTGGRPLRDSVIVLAGDRIVAVGGRHALPRPAGVRVIDLRGKYVIPGLFDMHAHWTVVEKIAPPLSVANGVTAIREMWGYPEVRAVHERIESGEILGPRMVMASTIVDGPVSLLGPPAVFVRTPDEARAMVRQAKAEGAEFVKVYSYLSPECLLAVADESRRQGLTFAGHHVYRMSVGDASDAGMRSFEHLHGIPVALSWREDEFRQRIAETPMDPANPRAFFRVVRELERQATIDYSPDRAAAQYARWIRNGSWQSPTLTVNRVMSSPAETYANDPRLKYMPAEAHAIWAAAVRVHAPVTSEEIAAHRDWLRLRYAMVGKMYEAGVPLLAGSDCGNPYCFPGFGVHDELELLVESGLTPLQALSVATRDAARFLRREHNMGTITPGKVADLVVLDADPLTDIRNTQRIDAVVTRGRFIDRTERLQILADVEAAAQDPMTARTATLPLNCGCLPLG